VSSGTRVALVAAGAAAVVMALARPAAARAGPPAVGTPAPAFSLVSGDGRTVRLSDFRGKWVVLYFYPKDFTSGCTLEAHNFQRDLRQYEKLGAVILGISVDAVDSHKNFCTKEGLAFSLLSDPDARVSAAYDSVTNLVVAKLSARNTFLIDPEGRIAKVFLGVRPARHSEEVLAALAALERR
jgi:peroxiredoxin Q/BCP